MTININIYYESVHINLNFSPTDPLSSIFSFVKGKFGISQDSDDFLFFHRSPYNIDNTPIGTIRFASTDNILILITKDNYSKLDNFMTKMTPSIVCEAATFNTHAQFIVNQISAMKTHISNFSKEETQCSVLSILPFDSLFDLSDDDKVKELAKWFKEQFHFVHDLPCHVCGKKTQPKGKQPPTLSEFKHLASNVEIFYCPSCGAVTRFPRYNDVNKIIETRMGRCGEFSIAFAAMLKALSLDVRLVNDFNDHIWVEFWSDEKQRYVHVDPCENIVDAPLVYETGWKKAVSWVVAVGEDQCQDVTKKYTQNIDGCIQRRTSLITDEWFFKYIRFKNEQFSSRLLPEGKKEIEEKQKKDLDSMELPKADIKAEEKLPRQS